MNRFFTRVILFLIALQQKSEAAAPMAQALLPAACSENGLAIYSLKHPHAPVNNDQATALLFGDIHGNSQYGTQLITCYDAVQEQAARDGKSMTAYTELDLPITSERGFATWDSKILTENCLPKMKATDEALNFISFIRSAENANLIQDDYSDKVKVFYKSFAKPEFIVLKSYALQIKPNTIIYLHQNEHAAAKSKHHLK
jgi:hypothetical protein